MFRLHYIGHLDVSTHKIFNSDVAIMNPIEYSHNIIHVPASLPAL